MDKKELVIQALQQRIAELVANYEMNNAILRAEITELVGKLEELQPKTEE